MNTPQSFTELMAHATALTRQGRVGEATRVIQQALQGRAATPSAPSAPSAPPVPPALGGVVLEGLVREVQGDVEVVVEADPAPARPASLAGGPARFESLAYASAQGVREYKLYTPAGLAADAPAPLVVMLHGCKQNPDDFAAGTRMNAQADAQGFRVLYPAQAPRSNMQRCWNWFQPGDQQRGRGEPALLAGMTRHVMQAHGVDAQRVYVAGLSAGGAMAAILAHEYPDLYAAAGVHSGLPKGAAHDLPSALAAMQQGPSAARPAARAPVPLIVFHGDRDDTVHPRNGDHLVAGHEAGETELARAPDGRAYRRTTYRDATGRVVAEHWLVQGMGHAWSGGSPAGSYTEARGPDATREMLRFFMRHSKTR